MPCTKVIRSLTWERCLILPKNTIYRLKQLDGYQCLQFTRNTLEAKIDYLYTESRTNHE